jgi:hypothetical protein
MGQAMRQTVIVDGKTGFDLLDSNRTTWMRRRLFSPSGM